MYIKNSKYNILTPYGFEDFDGVQMSHKDTIKVVFADNSSIRVTHDHLFVDKKASDLRKGEYVDSKLGQKEVKRVIYDNINIDVYDPINVSNRLYYSNDVVSHNCEFLGSINTIIDTETIKSLFYKYKRPILYDLQGCFRVYEKPVDSAEYVIGVDVGKGTGEHYSTIQVLRIDSVNPIQLEQVAVYENNKVDPYSFAAVVNRIAIYYNNAYIMAENNSEGSTVVSELQWSYENSGLVNSGSKNRDLGIRATRGSKPNAVILMKKLIEGNMVKIVDYSTINQLTDFIDAGNNRYYCPNLNDDLISALYWAVYIFKMNIFSDDYSFADREEEDEDGWGMLADVGDGTDEDWSWLTM